MKHIFLQLLDVIKRNKRILQRSTLGIVLIYDIFDVKSDYVKGIVGVLAAITPFHGDILTYYYCSYDYGFAFFL